MADVKFGNGYAWRVKKGGNREPVEGLGEALEIRSECSPCGCNEHLGFFTLQDIATDELYLVSIVNGALSLNLDTAANRTLYADCCRERAAGGATPSCDQLDRQQPD